MKFQEIMYVLALVACALLSQQCGGEMGSPPLPDADATFLRGEASLLHDAAEEGIG